MPLHDPEGSGQLLLSDGEPVAMVVWAHDFAERSQTGWFFVPLDDDGEPDHAWSRRLAADTALSRAAGIARAETVELVTAAAAVAAAERLLDEDAS